MPPERLCFLIVIFPGYLHIFLPLKTVSPVFFFFCVCVCVCVCVNLDLGDEVTMETSGISAFIAYFLVCLFVSSI